MSDWKAGMQAELERAEAARTNGNEGRARVCARRAAGIAAREYLARQGRILRTPSAYDLLTVLVEDEQLPHDVRQSARNLTLRVNEDFSLPVDVDLLAEARRLAAGLHRLWAE